MSDKKCEELKVIKKVYEQQKEIFEKGTYSIAGRIIRISKPHIRSIVRGNAGANVQKYPLVCSTDMCSLIR